MLYNKLFINNIMCGVWLAHLCGVLWESFKDSCMPGVRP